MTPEQLTTIRHFPEAEILATGGNVEGLSYPFFVKLDHFRDCLGCGFKLLPGGLNSGKHGENQVNVHTEGIAADGYPAVTLMSPTLVYRAALDAGLHGFGAYWNGTARSYHVDDRPGFAFWEAVWNLEKNDWDYYPFTITDPATLRVAI